MFFQSQKAINYTHLVKVTAYKNICKGKIVGLPESQALSQSSNLTKARYNLHQPTQKPASQETAMM